MNPARVGSIPSSICLVISGVRGRMIFTCTQICTGR